MTDRDRLIEILQDTLHEWECDVSIKTLTEITEHLIENGVICLPCKVGDNIYFPWIYNDTSGVAILEVYSIKMYVQGKPLVFIKDTESDMNIPNAFAVDDFGKTVFLDYKEAEKALNVLNK